MVKFADDRRPRPASETADSAQLNFAHSFKSIYYFSRIFGFKPFTIVFDSNGKIQTARIRVLDAVWLVITIGLYLSSALHFMIIASHHTFPAKSAILVNCTRSIYMLRKLFNVLSIVMDMYNRYQMIEIVKKINTFDEKASIKLCTLKLKTKKTLNTSNSNW